MTGPFEGAATFRRWCPVVILFLAGIRDGLDHRQPPKNIQALWVTLTSPLRDFITLQDLEEPPDEDVPKQIGVARMLVCLAIMNSFGWFAVFAYALMTQETWAGASIASVTWVGWISLVFDCRL